MQQLQQHRHRVTATDATLSTRDAAVRDTLRWRSIGPHRGGRVVTVSVETVAVVDALPPLG